MTKEKNNMDDFLRGSLQNIEIQPTQSVWKGISKRLIILELIRLNFTNIGKSWLYSGAALITAVSGFAYYSMSSNESPTMEDVANKQEQTISTQTSGDETKTIQLTDDSKTTVESKQSRVVAIVQNSQEGSTDYQNQITDPIIVVEIPQDANHKTENIAIATQPLVEGKDVLADTEEINPERTPPSSSNSLTNSPPPANREQLTKMPSRYDAKSSSSIYIYDPSSSWSARALLLSRDAKTQEFKNPTTKKQRKKTQFPISRSKGQQTAPILKDEKTGPNWYVSPSYMPEWSFSSEDMYVNNSQFSIQGGLSWEKLDISIGLGLKTEKTPSLFYSQFQSFDSVGFYYDIEYYEIDPVNLDTIILHYTIQNIYDSVKHESQTKGPDQRRRWVYVPIELGYQLFSTPKYELYGKISAKVGWEYFTEEIEMANPNVAGYYQENITPQNHSPYFQIGIGLQNDFNIIPQWWIYAEPRLTYYMKNPYLYEGTKKNGPFGFGIQVGIKYKFKGRQ